MGEAVLISIRPKWVSLIECGKKTIEVRKTRPRISTPFRCYIYQTLPKSGDWNDRDGRVVGEFTCDRIEDMRDVGIEETCLTLDEWRKYTKDHKGIVFGWHISELWMYDTPIRLDEFAKPCPHGHDCYSCGYYFPGILDYWHAEPPSCGWWETDEAAIRRAPQSWCYVEEM